MSMKSAALIATTALLPLAALSQDLPDPKVLVITMFDGEMQPWLDNLDLPKEIAIPGLPASAPALSCNNDLCVMTTAMGFANAASSVAAVALSDRVDLRDTYIFVAGIAGVDPEEGTLGSAHWARYVIDAGLRHLIDPREIPESWESGSLALGTSEPGGKDGWTAGTEIYELNAELTQRALEITGDTELADNEQAAEYRAAYTAEAARKAPFVSACDTLSADTYWHGAIIAKEMENRVARLTEGNGVYCTSQMEDNATLAALDRAAQAGKIDFDRIAVLRTASNFDRQAEGQTAAESLGADSGGFGPATKNAFRVGNALAQEIVSNLEAWANGIPEEN